MKKSNTIAAFLTLILMFITITDMNAIPAFARKYQMSCTTCHAPAFPYLKAFGDEFAGDGFRMKDTEAPRYFVNTGDEKLSLIRDFPIAIRLEGHMTYDNQNSDAFEFGLPWGVKLLSGGEISKKLSYYFYFYMSEMGEIAGIEDAFLTYSDLFGSGINISAGQFQVCDPLYKRELRLTLEDYVIYTLKPGNSDISLKYDRGIILDYGLPTGTDFVGMIVNGNGISEAGDNFMFDKDKYKNYFIKGGQDIGKMFNIGLFGYFGKENISDAGDSLTNSVAFWGPNLTFNHQDKFIVNVQYARRSDSRVLMHEEDMIIMEDAMTHGGFVEFIFSPKGDMSNWYLTLLGNWIDSDLDELDYSSATFHAGYMLRRNVRLVGEYTQQFENHNFGKASVGFIAAF
ncbi:MAG TPA: hypothetical protein VK994_03740 [Bacteroidales bacterium]|nr:hypothetical protein [Bacteroidales bacterium]